jgi:hypothetical protein
MLKEINRGNGLVEITDEPETMTIQRIHVRRRYKENPLDDILFILGIVLFSVLLCFGIPILQASELLYVLIMAGMVACMMYVAYRSGTKRGR